MTGRTLDMEHYRSSGALEAVSAGPARQRNWMLLIVFSIIGLTMLAAAGGAIAGVLFLLRMAFLHFS